jgi:uncharacterized protein
MHAWRASDLADRKYGGSGGWVSGAAGVGYSSGGGVPVYDWAEVLALCADPVVGWVYPGEGERHADFGANQHWSMYQCRRGTPGRGDYCKHSTEGICTMTLPDGRHLAFPFRIGSDGRTVTVASLEQHVRDELMQLMLTNPGERAFVPEFGAGVRRLVFEGAGDVTEAMAKAMISQAISRWLSDRIILEDLNVEVRNETILADLKYRIVGTPDSRQVRFERKGG